MRVFIAALLILIVIIGGGVWYAYRVDAIVGELLVCSDQIETAATEEDFAAAAQAAARMGELWAEHRLILSAFVDHADLRNVEISMAHIRGNALYHENGDIFAENAALREYLNVIAAADRLNWENIL